jgi:hypothetical protein
MIDTQCHPNTPEVSVYQMHVVKIHLEPQTGNANVMLDMFGNLQMI